MDNDIQDEVKAIGKRQKIYRKADEIRRRHSSSDTENIAMLYEKFSLENIEIGLKNRREIRAGKSEKKSTIPIDNQKVENVPISILYRIIRWLRH